MGYDLNRFVGPVPTPFLCGICATVLQDGVQLPGCEHAFCRACLTPLMRSAVRCPIQDCETTIASGEGQVSAPAFQPISRIIRNMIADMQIHCEYYQLGCNQVTEVSLTELHGRECDFNPTGLLDCPRECGARVARCELAAHNCVAELRADFGRQLATLSELLFDALEGLEAARKQIAELKSGTTSSESASKE